MTKLERLYTEDGQSPWLDNLTRGYLRDGTLARVIADGIRGVTASPTIFTKAIVGSADYDEQFSALTAAGCPIEDLQCDHQLILPPNWRTLADDGVTGRISTGTRK
jgi:transaldolase